MTAEQHIAEAEKWLEFAHNSGGHHDKATACAAIATAHATIAQAKKETGR